MNKMNKPAELSYYGLYLLSHLKENHPDKAGDAAFIEVRADHAADVYERARLDGYLPEGAHELAMAALLEGLNSGKVKAAGLDVWMSEKEPNWALAQHPAVSCTPHIGAGTKEAQKRIGAELVDIVEHFAF